MTLAHGGFLLRLEVCDERVTTVFDGPAEPRKRRAFPLLAPTPQGPHFLAGLGCDFIFIKPIGKNSSHGVSPLQTLAVLSLSGEPSVHFEPVQRSARR
jgi:hypothetical protein